MSNQQQLSQKEQYIQVVKDFQRLLEEKNLSAWMNLWADDAINHYPYGSGIFPEKIVGKQGIYENWKGVFELFESLSFPLHDIYVDMTKQAAIMRFDSHNIMKGGTRRYDNTFVCILIFNEEGKIKEYYEFFNPITLGVTFGLLSIERLQGDEAQQSQ